MKIIPKIILRRKVKCNEIRKRHTIENINKFIKKGKLESLEWNQHTDRMIEERTVKRPIAIWAKVNRTPNGTMFR